MSKANNSSSLTVVRPRGGLLKALRDKENGGEGCKQRVVEESTGIPLLRLSQYERGISIPIDHLSRLAIYYRVPVRELIEEDSLQKIVKLARVCQLTPKELSNGENV